MFFDVCWLLSGIALIVMALTSNVYPSKEKVKLPDRVKHKSYHKWMSLESPIQGYHLRWSYRRLRLPVRFCQQPRASRSEHLAAESSPALARLLQPRLLSAAALDSRVLVQRVATVAPPVPLHGPVLHILLLETHDEAVQADDQAPAPGPDHCRRGVYDEGDGQHHRGPGAASQIRGAGGAGCASSVQLLCPGDQR